MSRPWFQKHFIEKKHSCRDAFQGNKLQLTSQCVHKLPEATHYNPCNALQSSYNSHRSVFTNYPRLHVTTHAMHYREATTHIAVCSQTTRGYTSQPMQCITEKLQLTSQCVHKLPEATHHNPCNALRRSYKSQRSVFTNYPRLHVTTHAMQYREATTHIAVCSQTTRGYTSQPMQCITEKLQITAQCVHKLPEATRHNPCNALHRSYKSHRSVFTNYPRLHVTTHAMHYREATNHIAVCSQTTRGYTLQPMQCITE